MPILRRASHRPPARLTKHHEPNENKHRLGGHSLMATLIIKTGKHAGKVLKLPNGEVVVGRDEGCQIRLATNDVSRRHCLLKSTPAGLVVEDLGSRNATFVNDVVVEGDVSLKPGDLLRIGPAVFEIPKKKEDKKPTSTSSDDIADWLTADSVREEPDDPDVGDTTIVPEAGAAGTKKKSRKRSAPLLPPQPQKPQFESVAEEAADIIRRHNERKQGDS